MRTMIASAESRPAERETGRANGVVVAMEHLSKSFGGNHVLRDINLEIRNGENLVILGQSGTGKSVLIKCIVGLVDHDEGKLILLGQNIADLEHA